MRITFLILCGFLIIALVSFGLMAKRIRNHVEIQYSQASEEPLVDLSHLFAALLERDIRDGKIDTARFRESFHQAYQRKFLARIYNLEKDRIQTHVYVTDKQGIVIFDSDGGKREGQDFSQYNDVYLTLQGQYGVRSSRVDPDDPRTSVFYVGAPVYDRGELAGVLSVSRPETAMAPFADQSRALFLRWIAMAAFAIVVLGAIWTYWLLHPIRSLTQKARLIARGDSLEIPITGYASLRELSLALEAMRRELEGKHYVESYVSALTHELKSPLAAIRGAAELINESMPAEKRRQFLDNILAETARSEDLVRRLVQLAALESQSSLARREPVLLNEIIREALQESQSVIESRQFNLVVSGCDDEDLTVDGDPLMLRIAFRNILKNAIDFSPPGSSLEVKCLRNEDGGIEVSVKDEGPGLPDYALERAFERFFSLKNQETGRKGSGIGLCFVKESMELHGGRVILKNDPGGGAITTLIFPPEISGGI